MREFTTSQRVREGIETARAIADTGGQYLAKTAWPLRRGIASGTVPGLAGFLSLLGGLRALRRGSTKRGVAAILVGGGLLAGVVARRRDSGRTTDVQVSDVVNTGPALEGGADAGDGREDGTGAAGTSVVGTSPDIGAASEGIPDEDDPDTGEIDQREVARTGADELDATGETAETAAIDRLGLAAFDRQSREVPVPQRAFNQQYLAHGAEAYWGIRERDDGVLVAGDYDAMESREGVDYVASSEIGPDARELPIPDTVLDRWDEVYGGGTAVTGGDDILFVTTDALSAHRVLRVLPAAWAEDTFGQPA